MSLRQPVGKSRIQLSGLSGKPLVNLELDSLWSVMFSGVLFHGYTIYSMSVKLTL